MTSNERLPDPTTIQDVSIRSYLEQLTRALRFNFSNVDTAPKTIAAQEESVDLGSEFTTLNFLGTSITAVDAGGGILDVTITPGLAEDYTDDAILNHEGAADPHTQYILHDGTRAFTGGQTVADTPNAINSGDYPVQSMSGAVDSATAVGYVLDTVEALTTAGSKFARFLQGGKKLFDISANNWGTGTLALDRIQFDFFNPDNGVLSSIDFVEPGVFSNGFRVWDYTKSNYFGIMPAINGFVTSGVKMQFWTGGGSDPLFWEYSVDTKAIYTNKTDVNLGTNLYRFQNIYLRKDIYQLDNGKHYLGSSDDAVLYYDGTNVILNPKLVGSGFLDILGTLHVEDNFSIGTTTKTARCHLPAGTAAAGTASLKLTDGVLLTVPENGAIEYADGHYYVTNGVRQALVRSVGTKVTTTTVTNTVTETVLYSYAFAAEALHADERVVFSMNGAYSNDSASDDFTLRFKLNGVTHATVSRTAGNVTDQGWEGLFDMTVREEGASGTFVHFSKYDDTVTSDMQAHAAPEALDTTAAITFEVTIQWANAKVGNTFSCAQGDLQFRH